MPKGKGYPGRSGNRGSKAGPSSNASPKALANYKRGLKRGNSRNK